MFTDSFSGVRVTRYLVLCVCFVDRCLSFCTFSSGHCVVCPPSNYGFWLPLKYLQTLLKSTIHPHTRWRFHSCWYEILLLLLLNDHLQQVHSFWYEILLLLLLNDHLQQVHSFWYEILLLLLLNDHLQQVHSCWYEIKIDVSTAS